ncbi:MAG: hypothetical protein N2Z84_01290, partial [Atribacterota bacterium]|nr:hypothetical protein [Atribacterota bacterium]
RDSPASLGAAIIAGVGTGCFPSFEEGCGRYVATQRVFEPSSVNHKLYTTLFAQYRQLYHSLKEFNHSFPLLQ